MLASVDEGDSDRPLPSISCLSDTESEPDASISKSTVVSENRSLSFISSRHTFVQSLVTPCYISFPFHRFIPTQVYTSLLPVNMKSMVIAFAIFTAAFGAPVRRQTGNAQTFTSALGGIAATPVQDSGNPDRPFQVKDATFTNIDAALARSCDRQFNACANAANGGDATLRVAQCSTQKGMISTKRQSIRVRQIIS